MNIDFNCPYCNKQYSDEDDKYLNICNRNKSGWTSIKCKCGNKFGMTYDITGEAVSFELEQVQTQTRKLSSKNKLRKGYKTKGKPVVLVDNNSNLIGEYKSIKQAVESTDNPNRTAHRLSQSQLNSLDTKYGVTIPYKGGHLFMYKKEFYPDQIIKHPNHISDEQQKKLDKDREYSRRVESAKKYLKNRQKWIMILNGEFEVLEAYKGSMVSLAKREGVTVGALKGYLSTKRSTGIINDHLRPSKIRRRKKLYIYFDLYCSFFNEISEFPANKAHFNTIVEEEIKPIKQKKESVAHRIKKLESIKVGDTELLTVCSYIESNRWRSTASNLSNTRGMQFSLNLDKENHLYATRIK